MSIAAFSVKADTSACEKQGLAYFSWPFVDACKMAVRGGTTKGSEVELVARPSAQWLQLQAGDISTFERDRRAILAMAGEFRTSFNFLETMGFTASFEPAQPYFSWATEYVSVLEDSGDFISLQHILAMEFVDDEGNVSDTVVMKHWRQDWHYEKRSVMQYQNGKTWRRYTLSKSERKGTWAQAVFQVDDSPRYESWGKWQHTVDFSQWSSAITRRPLPRREYSVRSDYDFLEGTNQHTIVPNGWVHTEDNWKVKIQDNLGMDKRYVAKELGINRYERIKNFDFSEAQRYMLETEAYWADVRSHWHRLLSNTELTLTAAEGAPLFAQLFEGASRFRGDSYNKDASEAYLNQVIDSVVSQKRSND